MITRIVLRAFRITPMGISKRCGPRGWLGGCVALLTVAAPALVGQSPAPLHLPPLDRALPARAETIYQALSGRVDTEAAMEIVEFMAPRWRLAGNPEYNESIAL